VAIGPVAPKFSGVACGNHRRPSGELHSRSPSPPAYREQRARAGDPVQGETPAASFRRWRQFGAGSHRLPRRSVRRQPRRTDLAQRGAVVADGHETLGGGHYRLRRLVPRTPEPLNPAAELLPGRRVGREPHADVVVGAGSGPADCDHPRASDGHGRHPLAIGERVTSDPLPVGAVRGEPDGRLGPAGDAVDASGDEAERPTSHTGQLLIARFAGKWHLGPVGAVAGAPAAPVAVADTGVGGPHHHHQPLPAGTRGGDCGRGAGRFHVGADPGPSVGGAPGDGLPPARGPVGNGADRRPEPDAVTRGHDTRDAGRPGGCGES